jgi:hypothetical protein
VCLRGASAVERFIAQHREENFAVLVVWEPILPTDWTSPSRSTLARIPDSRARQFWDPNHLVSQELRISTEKHSLPEPSCCFDKGFYWDEVILYAPHSRWTDRPVPAFWNGPVVKAAPLVENALKALGG